MAADLRALIRYHRWRLDEKQRALAALRTREDEVVARAQALEDQIKAEQRAARDTFEVSFGYAGFARAALVRREQLARTLADIRAQLAAAAEDLAETFQEVKRYELAQEERVLQEKARIRHKEAELLDETAGVGFRRRQQEDEAGKE